MGKDSNTIASIHHLFKTVPIQVAQHLKTHMHDHVDEGKYQPVMTHTRSPTNLPTQIGNPISFCAVAQKSSKVFRVAKQNVAIATI